MKVEAEVKNMLNFHASNSCNCRGCYYGEDDWKIDAYGETEEELIKEAARLILESNINISDSCLRKVDCLFYKEYRFELGDGTMIDEHPVEFLQKIYASPAYKELQKEKEDAAKEAAHQAKEEAKKEKARQEKRQEEKEIATLKKLKEKYPNI